MKFWKIIGATLILSNPLTLALLALSIFLFATGLLGLIALGVLTAVLVPLGVASMIGWLIVGHLLEKFFGKTTKSQTANRKYIIHESNVSPSLDAQAVTELKDYAAEVRAALGAVALNTDHYDWDGTWPTVDRSRMCVTVLANGPTRQPSKSPRRARKVKEVCPATLDNPALDELSLEELLERAKRAKIRGVNSRWTRTKLIEKLGEVV